jgi:hypothetical protein
LVLEAVVAKELVVVALDEVELRAVKLSRVEEPESSRLESEVKPAVAVRVPLKIELPLTVSTPPTLKAPVVVAFDEVELPEIVKPPKALIVNRGVKVVKASLSVPKTKLP